MKLEGEDDDVCRLCHRSILFDSNYFSGDKIQFDAFLVFPKRSE